jgi:hypothetical protein
MTDYRKTVENAIAAFEYFSPGTNDVSEALRSLLRDEEAIRADERERLAKLADEERRQAEKEARDFAKHSATKGTAVHIGAIYAAQEAEAVRDWLRQGGE